MCDLLDGVDINQLRAGFAGLLTLFPDSSCETIQLVNVHLPLVMDVLRHFYNDHTLVQMNLYLFAQVILFIMISFLIPFQFARDAVHADNCQYVTAAAREAVCGFLAAVMNLIEWTPDISALSISTQVQHYFPGMVEFLAECPVPDVAARSADFNVDRFLFHLAHLKVCCFHVFFSMTVFRI